MRGSVGDVVAVPGGRDHALAVIDEVVSTITAGGIPPSDAAVTATRATLTQEGSPLTSSMYRDLVGGRRIEAEAIVGDLVKRARAAGIATPLLAAADVHLAVYAARMAKQA